MPEFLVLAFVWAQQFAEILSGIHEKREIELENIQEAKERFVRAISFILFSWFSLASRLIRSSLKLNEILRATKACLKARFKWSLILRSSKPMMA